MSGETSTSRYILSMWSLRPATGRSQAAACSPFTPCWLYPKQLWRWRTRRAVERDSGTAAQHCDGRAPGQDEARWSEAPPAGMYTYSSSEMDDIARCPIVKRLVVVGAAAARYGLVAEQDRTTILSWHDWTDHGPFKLRHAVCGVFHAAVRRFVRPTIVQLRSIPWRRSRSRVRELRRSVGRLVASRRHAGLHLIRR